MVISVSAYSIVQIEMNILCKQIMTKIPLHTPCHIVAWV